MFAALVGGDLARVVGEDAVDQRLQLGRVGDERVAEVRVRLELRVAALGQRLGERRARHRRARRDHLRELVGVDHGRVHAGRDEVVHEDVRRGLRIDTVEGDALVQVGQRCRAVEHLRVVERQPVLTLEAPDPLARELGQL